MSLYIIICRNIKNYAKICHQRGDFVDKEKRIKILKREIDCLSRVYNPKLKKVLLLKAELKELEQQ